ncbi:MAG: error-prone DNA polymerase [Deltaproteobacteria bacterium]|nr:error-prone DNA polymerase [Deltaproteobacteria bacterium]
MSYVELHCRSAYSFLDGASTPEALARRAKDVGLGALALTDLDDLGGVVRFSRAAALVGVRPIFGAEVSLDVGGSVVLLAEDLEGYRNLSRLVTAGRMNRPRGLPAVDIDTLAAQSRGLVCLGSGGGSAAGSGNGHGHGHGHGNADGRTLAGTLAEIFRGRFYIEVQDHALAEDARRVLDGIDLARRLAVPWLVTGDVRYAEAKDKPVQDALVCLKHRVTLDDAGDLLFPNDARRLAGPAEMVRRWRGDPTGLALTLEVSERCAFRLHDLSPSLPAYPLPPGVEDGDAFLAARVEDGARERYPRRREEHDRQLRHELEVIRRLGLAGYFLIVWDIVRFTRSRGVLVQGRGSAANSAVCYCLGITAVDPVGQGLLFERFLVEGRGPGHREPPDIDIDIAHRDREEVLQYVYERYGREHAAMVSETICWRGRSAVRDAARVLGLSTDMADALAREVGATVPTDTPASGSRAAADVLEAGGIERAGLARKSGRIRALVRLVRGLEGLPRHRGIHVGGFVLTREALRDVVPIEPAAMAGRTVIQWDKSDLGHVGLVKVDLLGLGVLTLLGDALALVDKHRGERLDLARLPVDDPPTYRMIRKADTVGVFQIESRAQMATLPRMAPERFYDLVVQVALIRPGPIQGEMVHPYLRRRRGEEPVRYLDPSLEPALARTLGVPLFQEQGMKVAIAAAGFTADQADELRRAMGDKGCGETRARLSRELLAGMRRRGLRRSVRERIAKLLRTFASYGFPESHAASFALLVYASAYLKRHYTPEFYAALLNAQPMGFYPVGTVVTDARRHGIELRRPDVTKSLWDATLEPASRGPHAFALRLGLRIVRGIGPRARLALEGVLGRGIESIEAFARDSGLDAHTLTRLARAGAFDGLAGDRRRALWEVLRIARPVAGPLAPHHPAEAQAPEFPPLAPAVETREDYASLGTSAERHPMEFHRDWLAAHDVPPLGALPDRPPGPVRVAGLINSLQRPATAKGFVFLSLEDETGMVNVVVSPTLFARHHDVITRRPVLLVDGSLERRHDVVNIKAAGIQPLPRSSVAGGSRGC